MRRTLPVLCFLLALWMPAAPAAADPVSIVRLMAPGPLPEMALGDPAAPVSIVEYVSMTCSHCADFHADTFETLKTKYIDTGKVYFALREYPIDPLALAAIVSARCAPQDQFFPIVEALFRDQSKWAFVPKPAPALIAELEPFGFTKDSFEACLNNGDIVDGVNRIAQTAQQEFGVSGTPTFFVNGERHVGAMDFVALEALIAPLLTKASN